MELALRFPKSSLNFANSLKSEFARSPPGKSGLLVHRVRSESLSRRERQASLPTSVSSSVTKLRDFGLVLWRDALCSAGLLFGKWLWLQLVVAPAPLLARVPESVENKKEPRGFAGCRVQPLPGESSSAFSLSAPATSNSRSTARLSALLTLSMPFSVSSAYSSPKGEAQDASRLRILDAACAGFLKNQPTLYVLGRASFWRVQCHACLKSDGVDSHGKLRRGEFVPLVSIRRRPRTRS
mmetsp:Transcript_4286/g.9720  ORF Transcript_4286/g.9720 Transcript_4286/m.9720 type:complete len:239 (-) Transcript_4286:467-1183(-)